MPLSRLIGFLLLNLAHPTAFSSPAEQWRRKGSLRNYVPRGSAPPPQLATELTFAGGRAIRDENVPPTPASISEYAVVARYSDDHCTIIREEKRLLLNTCTSIILGGFMMATATGSPSYDVTQTVYSDSTCTIHVDRSTTATFPGVCTLLADGTYLRSHKSAVSYTESTTAGVQIRYASASEFMAH